MSISRVIDKDDMVHTHYIVNYYSAIKTSKIVPSAEVWINLETVIQREVSQKENKYHTISLRCGI